VEQLSMPSKTWDASSGGTKGDGGPIMRSSPVRIVSSAIFDNTAPADVLFKV